MVRRKEAPRRILNDNGAALGLKLLLIALTILGATSLWLASAADTGAPLRVIFNGLRLLGKDSSRAGRHGDERACGCDH